MSEWKPIETAPKDGRQIMVWAEDFVPFVRWDNGWVSEFLRWNGRPTHWMPMPEAPENAYLAVKGENF